MRELGNRIVQEFDTGEDTILVGHSVGGVIACATAPRFVKSNLLCVVTIFSPHTYFFSHFSRTLKVDKEALARIPILSFGARFDALVPFGAQFPRAKHHEIFESDHLFRLMFSSKPAARIAAVTRHFLQQPLPP